MRPSEESGAESIEKRIRLLRIIEVAVEGVEAACAALRRTTLQDNPRVETIVREIIVQVRERGDAALLELGRRFDSPDLAALEVPFETWREAEAELAPELRRAVVEAAANIREFHEKQRRTSWLDAQPDRITGQLVRPLDRVGVYIPGGTAAYPSTVLMNVVPAKVAGVREVIGVTPPGRGATSRAVLAAAHIAGIDRLFRVGGAQAVAALAYGTRSVP